MSGWTVHKGTAVVLDHENIDTDQLIPARFMSTPRSEGYGQYLLHDMQHAPSGDPITSFPLKRVPHATVLVTRRNFGSGSSREAAVYALVDFGISAVVAPSFGDIFASNAVNNGLLPARVGDQHIEDLIAHLGPEEAVVQIDLSQGTLRIGELSAQFDLDPVWREKLINGWDDIDLTRHHDTAIASYRAKHSDIRSWAFPQRETAE